MDDKKLDILELIVEIAKNNNDISQFGQLVAEVLNSNKLIDDVVFEILTKK